MLSLLLSFLVLVLILVIVHWALSMFIGGNILKLVDAILALILIIALLNHLGYAHL